jgi:multidrug efflux pump subunit AcrB
MIALVRIALSRPYTFVVLALLFLIIGPVAALRAPTEIFPGIRVPVIGVVWRYPGLPRDQMSGRVTTPFERSLTTTVNDIEHIVANSYNGVGINGEMVYVQDVATVRDGNAPQTDIGHVDGNRSVLMMVLKAGSISTLDIIAGIKRKVIEVRDSLPDALATLTFVPVVFSMVHKKQGAKVAASPENSHVY